MVDEMKKVKVETYDISVKELRFFNECCEGCGEAFGKRTMKEVRRKGEFSLEEVKFVSKVNCDDCPFEGYECEEFDSGSFYRDNRNDYFYSIASDFCYWRYDANSPFIHWFALRNSYRSCVRFRGHHTVHPTNLFSHNFRDFCSFKAYR